ncbi:hypothetical protein ACGC1H_002190 [Rhizoctonia solani]
MAEPSMRILENSSSTIAPISSLPPELLSRIFYAVLDDQIESLDDTYAPREVLLSFPKYPETLSHVCSRWRQITITSRGLWTRIDLVLYHSFNPGFLARAKVHVDRAGELPLDIHMVDLTLSRMYGPQPHTKPKFIAFDFLASTRKPMNALNLVSYRGLRDEHYNFVRYCITNCAPRTLKQLVIRDACGVDDRYGFIEFARNPHDPRNLQIDLPEQSLENVWSSVTVLRLAGLYPCWTSRAYHQLVDLRLGPKFDSVQSPPISEAQILEILKASPGLRIFHLHLNPIDPLPDNASVSTFQLNELESVNLSFELVNPSRILRFIIPGKKPMQLSLFGPPTDVIEEFLRHSNVTRFRMVDWKTYPPANALCLCPNLQVLVLDVWGSLKEYSFQTIQEQGGGGTLVAPIRIPALCILYGQGMTLSDLQRLVENHHVQELTLWCTYPIVGDGHSSDSRIAYESEVSLLCPVVNYLGYGDRNPMDAWDLF